MAALTMRPLGMRPLSMRPVALRPLGSDAGGEPSSIIPALPGMSSTKSVWRRYDQGLPASGPVSAWTGGAGGAPDPTAAGSSRPIRVTTGIQLDRVDDFMRIAGAALLTSRVNWAVVTLSTVSVQQYVMSTRDAAIGGGYAMRYDSSAPGGFNQFTTGVSDIANRVRYATTATPVAVVFRHVIGAGMYIYLNGTLVDTDTGGAFASAPNAGDPDLCVGSMDGTANWFGGAGSVIHDFGQHDGNLSAPDLAALLAELEAVRTAVNS